MRPRISVLVLFGVLLALPVWGDGEPDSSRAGDSFVWRGVVVSIQSATGIGSLEIRPENGSWPDVFRIRFLSSSGCAMSRLEGLALQSSGGEGDGFYQDGEGHWQAHGADHLAGLEAHWESVNGAAELVVTSHHLGAGDEPLRIRWVDVYRH